MKALMEAFEVFQNNSILKKFVKIFKNPKTHKIGTKTL